LLERQHCARVADSARGARGDGGRERAGPGGNAWLEQVAG